MSGLANLHIPRSQVEVSEGVHIVLRGLSATDISVLMSTHIDALAEVYDAVLKVETLTDESVLRLAADFLQKAPAAVADIIALASDEPDLASVASKLPLPVQVEALDHIVHLTFSAGGGVGKVAEIAGKMFKSLQKDRGAKRA